MLLKNTKILLKKTCFFILLLIGLTIQAQEQEKKWFDNFSISGSIDGYFRYNIDAPNKDLDPTDDIAFLAPATSFANQSGFSLGMANVILGYEDNDIGFIADFVYGPRGTDAVFSSTGSSNIINQLYVYWNISEKTTFTLGNFNTFLGYEVITPSGNFNYSTSYMFSYGPFSHTGLKADFTLTEKWSAMLAIMNPTDFTENNPFDTYIIGAQLGYTIDKGSAYLNVRYGNEGDLAGNVGPTLQIDLTSGWDISDTFYLGINSTYLSTEPQINGDPSGFYGVALYPQLKTSEKFTLGLRGEYFSEYNFGLGVIGLDSEGDGSVIAVTLTGNYTLRNLTFKPEIRVDSTSQDSFVNKDLDTTKTLSSFVLGAVYKF